MKKAIMMLVLGMIYSGCSPTIKVQAPDKPLEINLNVKVDHEIKVKVDKELNDVMENNEDIF